jgi:hypothetical protein
LISVHQPEFESLKSTNFSAIPLTKQGNPDNILNKDTDTKNISDQ